MSAALLFPARYLIAWQVEENTSLFYVPPRALGEGHYSFDHYLTFSIFQCAAGHLRCQVFKKNKHQEDRKPDLGLETKFCRNKTISVWVASYST